MIPVPANMKVWLAAGDAARRRLEDIAADRNSPQKHVWRARIVLMSADGVGTNAIMAATGTAKTTVWRWQERFMAEGVDGLLRDKTRPPGRPPVPDERAARVVEMTLKPPPHEATHWTARAMAQAAGLAVSTVQGIWKAHGLAPHRWRRFKLSKDPAFAETSRSGGRGASHAIVGLYVAPFECCQFDSFEGAPRSAAPDEFGLEEVNHRLGEGVVV